VNRVAGENGIVTAPGRVNLIGEHIDYHGLAVLPMALQRRVRVAFRPRRDRCISASSTGYGARCFEWTPDLAPVAAGDWENYLRAAARVARPFLRDPLGIDAEITSDLPAAAGLSSSSALLVAFTLGLLRANGYNPGFEELMEVLPDGEQFVGTRGGGMDHAAVLGSRAGCASWIGFEPLTLRPIAVPPDWVFLIADSGVRAEKSGAARQAYNRRRTAGKAALERLGLESFREAEAAHAARLKDPEERAAFLHVTTEKQRVAAAVKALAAADLPRFGALLVESHTSLRDQLQVSCPELDRLVDRALELGAAGARLTGAGFGGCAVIACARARAEAIAAALPAIATEPGPGALADTMEG
jgi:galactokinase